MDINGVLDVAEDADRFVDMVVPNKPDIYGAAAGKVLKIVVGEPIPDDLLVGSSEDRIEKIFGAEF